MGNGGTHEFVWSSSFPDLESNKWIYSLKYWLKFHKLVSSVLLMTCTVEPSHQNNNLLQTLSSVCILSQIFFEYNDPKIARTVQKNAGMLLLAGGFFFVPFRRLVIVSMADTPAGQRFHFFERVIGQTSQDGHFQIVSIG